MPFNLLHDLMDVPVEYRYGPEPLQIGQRAFAVLRAPSPFGVHGPQRNVCKHDDRRAAREAFDVFLEPFELLGAEPAEAARLEVDDVHEADEVNAALIEAVPPG